MKIWILTGVVALLLSACDNLRVYESNYNFEEGIWIAHEQPTFEFTIADTSFPYTLSLDLRNSLSYPYTRLFITYELIDSTGSVLTRELVPIYLFDDKTGTPLGTSGIGDLYDHRFPLLSEYMFQKPGAYQLKLQQYMRKDTLDGLLSVGVRVEKALID